MNKSTLIQNILKERWSYLFLAVPLGLFALFYVLPMAATLFHYCPVISRIKTNGYKVGLIRFGGRTS